MKMEEIEIGKAYEVGNHPVYGPWVVTVIARGGVKVFCAYRHHGSNIYWEGLFDPEQLG